MLFFQLEDLEASLEVVCFPRAVTEFGPLVRADAVVVVSGRVDQRGDGVKLIAQTLREPELTAEQVVRLRVPALRLSQDLVAKLRSVLTNHPGRVPVYLHMTGDQQDTVVRLGEDHTVEPRTALFAELRELLGPDAILR